MSRPIRRPIMPGAFVINVQDLHWVLLDADPVSCVCNILDGCLSLTASADAGRRLLVSQALVTPMRLQWLPALLLSGWEVPGRDFRDTPAYENMCQWTADETAW